MEFHKKKAETAVQPLVPQGGFEPPQSEPESEVLPLHNRGMSVHNIQIIRTYVNNFSYNFRLFYYKFFLKSDKFITINKNQRRS